MGASAVAPMIACYPSAVGGRFALVGALAVTLTFASSGLARAQEVPMDAALEGAQDDVPFELRRRSYDGGPIRPGARLHGGPKLWLVIPGVLFFIGGYAMSAVAGATWVTTRQEGFIPLVGPWLGAFGVLSEDGRGWQDTVSLPMVIGGVVQIVGVLATVLGLALPDLDLVYEAPVGQPSLFDARLRFELVAPGAEVGASVVLEAF